MTGPAVTAVEAAVYVIPTDAPEADGTLTWDKTTVVLVAVHAGDERGMGWSYTSAAAQTVITEALADIVVGRSALDILGTAEAMARQVRNIGRTAEATGWLSAPRMQIGTGAADGAAHGRCDEPHVTSRLFALGRAHPYSSVIPGPEGDRLDEGNAPAVGARHDQRR